MKLGMYRPSILLVFGTVLMLHQPYTVAAKKNEAKKSHGDLAQDAELVNGNPWALLIDAGSGGSRMHLYEWEPRVYHTLPPPIAKPFTSEVWTERMKPGISTFAQNPEGVGAALTPLIEFAKKELASLEKQWSTFPIFLKATAGMRELPLSERMPIMLHIRAFLANKTTNPFFFDNVEMARVISGEEEAAYAWAGVNLATGALLSTDSWGTGAATPTSAYGTLEMGGASSQVAFYQPEQSIVENLFKLQIGGSKHWNIYAHSFLQYGRDSARNRMWSKLARDANCFRDDRLNGHSSSPVNESHAFSSSSSSHSSSSSCVIQDACLAVGASTVPVNAVTGETGVAYPLAYQPWLSNAVAIGKEDGLLPLSDHIDPPYSNEVDDDADDINLAATTANTTTSSSSTTVAAESQGNLATNKAKASSLETRWEACLEQVIEPLGFNKMLDSADSWCMYSHLGQCSFAGVYQPSLPEASTAKSNNGGDEEQERDGPYGNFILIGGYVTLFKKLGLPLGVGTRVTLRQLQAKGTEMCAMDKDQLEAKYGEWPQDASNEGDDEATSGDSSSSSSSIPPSSTRRTLKSKKSKGKVVSYHKEANVAELCFLAAYGFAMLRHGHGFDLDRNFTAVDTMAYNGATLSVGWQLGAILYEVNTLPYVYEPLSSNASTPKEEDSCSEPFPAGEALVASLIASLLAVAATLAVAWMRFKPPSTRSASGRSNIELKTSIQKGSQVSYRMAVGRA